MTKPRILPVEISGLDLEREISHTRSRLSAYAFLAALVGPYDAMLASWLPHFQEELALERDILDAEAAVVAIDDRLDALAYRISNTLLAELDGKRSNPVYQHYFKEAPSRMRRPVLGAQLETMRGWVESLTDAQSSAALKACGQELGGVVQEADEASKRLGKAQKALDKFKEIGPRKEFVDQLNALRQATHGQLAEMPFNQPGLKLLRDFPMRFFLRDTSNRKPTMAEVEQTVLRLREQLKRQEELLTRLAEEAEEEARVGEEEEVRAAEEALQAVERQREEAERRVEEVRARVGRGKRK